MSDQQRQDEIKAERRKQYLKHYQRQLRKKKKRLEIYLDHPLYKYLERAAIDHNMKVATFARACIHAHLGRSPRYIVPDNEVVRQLELAIRKIGNNINQVSRLVNTKKLADQLDIETINHHLAELEDAITDALRHPPDLLELINQHLDDDPTLADQIQARLDRHGGTTDVYKDVALEG